ncbi:natterin-3-like [Strigops habroptila]|uniref:Natterin-3-like n=1 Tax=Strigops habroptila TaxID=2489341 RepID=A0A672U8Y2_STRHB|nr:natterin-3-like [Strigops habroptila]
MRMLELFLLLFLLQDAGMSPMGAMGIPQPRGSSRSPRWVPRTEDPPSPLKWVQFRGQVPNDTVSNWNDYAKRLEFVCSAASCDTGAHVPARGPFCFYPFAEREHRSEDFKLLVNTGGFEALRWVDASFGAVPEGAVESCPYDDIFVARTSYGLGKVVKEERAAFVVVDGEEVWFKWYQVLVAHKGPSNVTIGDVLYNVSEAVVSTEDVTLTQSTVRNQGCGAQPSAIPMEEATEVEHDWELTPKLFSSIQGVLEAAPLLFNGTSWDVANVSTMPWAGGASTSEYVLHKHVLEQEVAPGTACAVALVGRRVDARVPFTARVTRVYGDGFRHRVAAAGWARTRSVLGVSPSFGPCWPIDVEPPCRV